MNNIDLSKYTRKEFVKFLKETSYCIVEPLDKNNPLRGPIICPESIGLAEDDNKCRNGRDCEGCWLTAIEKVKFKKEGE